MLPDFDGYDTFINALHIYMSIYKKTGLTIRQNGHNPKTEMPINTQRFEQRMKFEPQMNHLANEA